METKTVLFFFCLEQVEDANFSLNHPNQYFIESQKVLGGGRDIKREADTPQRSQENSAAKGSNAANAPAANAPAANAPAANNVQDLPEMTEDLDSFFLDA